MNKTTLFLLDAIYFNGWRVVDWESCNKKIKLRKD